MSLSSVLIVAASLLPHVLARTDLAGCTSTDVSSPAGASLAWYVPGTGELCDFLDCGGGMAPPKTDVPGCPLYSGTSTYSPSYMPGWGSATATPPAWAASSSSSWSAASATSWATDSAWSSATTGGAFPNSWMTDSSTSNWDLYTTAPSSASDIWGSASLVTSRASLFPSGYVAANTTLSTAIGSTGGVRSGTTTTAVAAASGSTGGSSSAASGASSGASSSAASSTPSSITAANGAETARVWMGSAVMAGLGAVVMAL